MNEQGQATMELPRYKCHKDVWALKIATIEIHEDKSATIVPVDTRYASFKTVKGWGERFKGSEEDKGYFIQYADGYTSWSPTQVFECGYTRDI